MRPQRPAARFAQIETAFLAHYGEIGRRFYAGLGTKTERLEQHLHLILRLKTTATSEQIMQAMAQAVTVGSFDATAVAYALYRRTTPARPAVTPLPLPMDIDVPVRDLETVRGGRIGVAATLWTTPVPRDASACCRVPHPVFEVPFEE